MRIACARSRDRRSAQATTEACLFFPLMLVLMLGIIDLGWLCFVQISIHYAVWHTMLQGVRDNSTGTNPTAGPRFPYTNPMTLTPLQQILIQSAYFVNLTQSEVAKTTVSQNTASAPFPGYNYYNVVVDVQHVHHFLVPAMWNSNATQTVYSHVATYVVKGLN